MNYQLDITKAKNSLDFNDRSHITLNQSYLISNVLEYCLNSSKKGVGSFDSKKANLCLDNVKDYMKKN